MRIIPSQQQRASHRDANCIPEDWCHQLTGGVRGDLVRLTVTSPRDSPVGTVIALCRLRYGVPLVLAPFCPSLLKRIAMLRSTSCRFMSMPLSLGFVAVCLIGIVKSPAANAGELNAAYVPADAQWLIHVDYESLSDSPMWQKIRDEKPIVTKMLHGKIKQRYGIDLSTELKSITLFSSDYKIYTGTVIVHADYDASKIEKRMKQAIDHRTTKFNDHTLHTVTLSKQPPADDGPSGDEEMTLVMVDKNTLLLASSVENAKKNLKRMAGQGESLKDKPSKLLSDQVDKAWIYAAAVNLGELKDHPVSMPVIAQHERITWSLGEQSDGKIYERAELVAQSAEVAQKMKKVLDGIVAFETLRADGSESMTALMKEVKVNQDGKTAMFEWSGSSDQVVAALDDVFARMKTWQSMFMNYKPTERSVQ